MTANEMKKAQLRLPFEYDAKQVTDNCALYCPEETRTHQEFKEECDINTIIDRFGIGNEFTPPDKWIESIDLIDAPNDYQSVMNQINAAKEQFMSIPAKVRAQFDNDPGQFMAFVADPANVDEMVRLGLANVVPAPSPSDADRIVEAIMSSREQSSS